MRVFVYGTLRDPDTAAAVLDSVEYLGPATLEGFHRVEGTYPTLGPGGSVRGRILVTDDVAALDPAAVPRSPPETKGFDAAMRP